MLGACVVLLVSAGIAFATIPDSGGLIHACYRSSGGGASEGQARIVESASDCRSHETHVSWNQSGPTGRPGLSGYVRAFTDSGADGRDFKVATATCPPGTRVLGGGANTYSPAGEHHQAVYITDSFPTGEAWFGNAAENAERGAVWGLHVTAICASVAP